MEKVEYAIKYIKLGWTITPIRPNVKIPRGKWKDLEWQFNTEEQVLGHWLDYPNDNIGIITGLSGIKVVDVDSAKNKVDSQYIQEILSYPTLTVKTQSGGFHYYYKSAGDKKDNLGVVEGIDIKGDGYVLAPPSSVEGRKYVFIEKKELAPMPTLTFLSKPSRDPFFAPKTPPKISFDDNELAKLTQALAYISPEDYATWIKVGMAIKEAGGDVTLWEDWSRGSEKYIAGECEKKWDSFKGTGVGLGSVYHLAKQGGYKIEAPKMKVGNMLKKGGQKEAREEVGQDNFPINLIEQGRDLSWLGDGTRKYAYFETGIDWIDKNMHGLQKRTILTAPSNTGKTQLALQIAQSVSRSGRKVLYIDMEQPIEDLWIRVMTMGTPVKKEHLLIDGKKIMKSEQYKTMFEYKAKDAENIYWTDLEHISSVEELSGYIDAWADQQEEEPLVIIDQVSGLKKYTGKETMYEQTQEIADWLRYGIKGKRWTLLLLSPQNKAHNNKVTEVSISGSGELAYAVDCVMILSKVEDDKDQWDRKRIKLNISKTRASLSVFDYYLRRTDRDELELIQSSLDTIQK